MIFCRETEAEGFLHKRCGLDGCFCQRKWLVHLKGFNIGIKPFFTPWPLSTLRCSTAEKALELQRAPERGCWGGQVLGSGQAGACGKQIIRQTTLPYEGSCAKVSDTCVSSKCIGLHVVLPVALLLQLLSPAYNQGASASLLPSHTGCRLQSLTPPFSAL